MPDGILVYLAARCFLKSDSSTTGQENKILLPSRIAGIRPFLMWSWRVLREIRNLASASGTVSNPADSVVLAPAGAASVTVFRNMKPPCHRAHTARTWGKVR